MNGFPGRPYKMLHSGLIEEAKLLPVCSLNIKYHSALLPNRFHSYDRVCKQTGTSHTVHYSSYDRQDKMTQLFQEP